MTNDKATPIMFKDLYSDIKAGMYDDYLSVLEKVISSRQRFLREQEAALLQAGDNVVFRNIKPKYLENGTGVIVSIEGDKAKVQLDSRRLIERAYRYASTDGCVTAPLTSLRKLEPITQESL